MDAGFVELLVLLCHLIFVNATVPDGYIMEITPTCGTNVTSARLDVITDLNADVKAECRDGNVTFFHTPDTVNFHLNVSYPGSVTPFPCTFDKKVSTEVYVVRVIVSFGEVNSEVYNDEEVFTVTCTFDPKGNETSTSQVIQGRLIAPREIQYNSGNVTKSSLSLQLTDVNGAVRNTSIELGRKVMLLASSDGASGEKGLRITSCNALSSIGQTYQVIRAGCGDGFVFQQDNGFISDGLVAMSPYFDMFKLHGDSNVTFKCNFTLCQEECDGSSCESSRKRSIIEPPGLTLNGWHPLREKRSQRYKLLHLQLSNVAWESLEDMPLDSTRHYMLVAHLDKRNVKGFVVEECHAITTKRHPAQKVNIVANGCGVEPVFNSTQGFVQQDGRATSPYFKGFNIAGDYHLRFECRVLICNRRCDGSSCEKRKRKREVDSSNITAVGQGVMTSLQFIINTFS